MKRSTEWLCIVAVCVCFFAIGACSASQEKSLSPVEIDLCKARSAFKLLEAVDQSLAPKAGSLRADVEKSEDALCLLAPASVSDAGVDAK